MFRISFFLHHRSMEQLLHDYPFNSEFTISQKLYHKGEVIYHAETPSFGFYFIISGTVKIYTTDKSGRDIILRLARPGDIIGYEYLLGEKNHTDSTKALEDTVCRFIDGNEYQALMLNNPSLGMMIMKKMKEELGLFQSRCVELLRKNVRERLASYFHYMAENCSDVDEMGIRIKIQMSREEIASLIGTANETAIRFIGEFKEMGLVREDDRVFHILDKERLAVIARLK